MPSNNTAAASNGIGGDSTVLFGYDQQNEPQ